MLDPKLLRQTPEQVQTQLARRGFNFDVVHYQDLEVERKKRQAAVQTLQQEKNQSAKQVGQAKAKGEAVDALLANVAGLHDQLHAAEAALQQLEAMLQEIHASIPNLPDDDVPDGKDETGNVEFKTWATPTQFTFQPQDHIVLGEQLGQMDFALATKLSGSRFVTMNRDIARLHRALIQFMLDTHVEKHGYQEMYLPYLTKLDCFYGTGQLPKFTDDLFMIAGDHGLGLISTAEVPLTNIARDTIFEPEALPLQFTAHTPCFRSEAGSYGKDTKGLIRQHQFEKVELVHLVAPEDSSATLLRLVEHAEAILQALKLPYRIMTLCAGDLGFSAAKTYDLEVWLPGQNQYREISSCSNCRDFQARRMQARWRHPQTKKPSLIHTLNGSGVAAGRALVAIMENYQHADGSVGIPEVLQPYMSGLKTIEKKQ